MLAAVFYFLLYLVLAGAVVLTIYAAIIGAPYVWTPKKAIRQGFSCAGLKKGDVVYDLGAGTAKALIIAEKEFGCQTIGFELSPFLYLIGRLNLLFRRAKYSRLYFKNFYHQPLAQADVIFCFLTPQAMAKLKLKFETELKSGARIVSYSFSVPGWPPKKIISGFGNKIFVYEK